MNSKNKLLTILNKDIVGFRDDSSVEKELPTIVSYFRNRTNVKYLFDARECETLDDQLIIDEAEAVLRGEIFGHTFNGPIDWTFNPTAETSRDNEWSWSLFRTIYWQPLARAYALTKDERYAAAVSTQLKSFFEAWPAQPFIEWDEMDKSTPFPGHAWRTIESGIRIYTTWLPCLEILKNSPSFDEDTWATFLCSIHDHGTFLSKHYSNHDRSSNWLSMESSALLQLGIMFPEMKDSASWREKGYQRVMHEIVYCFDDDGAHMEHTPIYHLVASITFLQAVRMCELNRIVVAPYAFPLLEKSAEYVMCQVKPDFSTAMTGDADRNSLLGRTADSSLYEGMNLSFFCDDLNELRAYFAWWAKRTGRQDFLYMASGGKEGIAPEQLDYHLKGSGIAIMRTGFTNDDSYLHMLGIKLERGERSTHSHNDTGHLELMVHGNDILIDCGRYIYNRSIYKDWRHYFTGALAHNTLYVDDHAMGTIPNVNRVRGVRPFWHAFRRGNGFLYMDMSHNGYVFTDDPIYHRRKVLFLTESESTVIVDHVSGPAFKDHDMRFIWNFATTHVIQLDNRTAEYTAKDGSVFVKRSVSSSKEQVSCELFSKRKDAWQSNLFCGSENPKAGWVSYGYPVREPIAQIQDCLHTSVPITMVTVISKVSSKVDMSVEGESFSITIDKDKVIGNSEDLEVSI